MTNQSPPLFFFLLQYKTHPACSLLTSDFLPHNEHSIPISTSASSGLSFVLELGILSQTRHITPFTLIDLCRHSANWWSVNRLDWGFRCVSCVRVQNSTVPQPLNLVRKNTPPVKKPEHRPHQHWTRNKSSMSNGPISLPHINLHRHQQEQGPAAFQGLPRMQQQQPQQQQQPPATQSNYFHGQSFGREGKTPSHSAPLFSSCFVPQRGDSHGGSSYRLVTNIVCVQDSR